MMRKYRNTRKASNSSGIQRYWLRIFVAITIIVVGIILYRMNLQLPNGILINEPDLSVIQTNYEQMIDRIREYDVPYPYDDSKAKIITAKQGYEQILYHELRKAYPSADISYIQMERRLRLQIIELIWFMLGMHILLAAIRRIWPKAKSCYIYVIYGLGFLSICYYMKANFVLPSQWIPVSLIDFHGWRSNMEKYKISSSAFNHWHSSQDILWITMGVGIVFYIVISMFQKVRGSKIEK